jgi:hypothetical protein
MRVVIMPFVESGQDAESLGDHRALVERDGELLSTQSIGCQMYMTSDLEKPRLIVSAKDAYFATAERILPKLVKDYLDPMGFYDVPDPADVDRVAESAAHMPTELFVLIQSEYDPEYLFLPEINYFFFRYPRPHGAGKGLDSGFGFVQVSAFLLDNRENRIVGRGSGSGLELYQSGNASLDENFSVPAEAQAEVMRAAGARAVESLLRTMKMIK